ncbi:Uncharacterised protein [uncultured Blautia sp.]|nr:Uncharacterised protein [uncultured Blautia sp.]
MGINHGSHADAPFFIGVERNFFAVVKELHCALQAFACGFRVNDLPVWQGSLLPEDVFSPNFKGTYSKFFGDQVKMGFPGETALGYAHAPHGTAVKRIGKNQVSADGQVRNMVWSAAMDGGFHQLSRTQVDVCAGVGIQGGLIGKYGAVFFHPGPMADFVGMTNGGSAHVVFPGKGHFYRAAGLQRKQYYPGLRQEIVFPAKTAADSLRNTEADLAHGHFQNAG